VRVPKVATVAVTAVALAGIGTTTGWAASKTFTASMNGSSEVPAGDPDGKGTAVLKIDRAKGKVCYDIKLSKVGTVTAGHIHAGAKGKAGDVVVPLFDKKTKHPKGCVTKVKKSVLKDIAAHPGNFYVNVHNAKYPAGAVRGQLRG
jgi:hypothetical protein